jgi:hypothetical protein
LASASNANHSASLVSFVESPPSALCFIARQTLLAARIGSPFGTAHIHYPVTEGENSIIVMINSPTGQRWLSIVQRTKLTRCRRSREVRGCKSRPECPLVPLSSAEFRRRSRQTLPWRLGIRAESPVGSGR